MSSNYCKISTLPYLYYASPGVIDDLWQSTYALTKKIFINTAKSDVLKKATYPILFSNGITLMLSILDEDGEIKKVCHLKNTKTKNDKLCSESSKVNILSMWPGDNTGDVLYIVNNWYYLLNIKYAVTDNEGKVPDVLFINSFKHSIKNTEMFNKYKYIVAIGTNYLNNVLDIYGIKPTISVIISKKNKIDPIYIILRLLDEIINEKNLHKSANVRITIEELARLYPSIFSDISISHESRAARETLCCLRS